MDYNHNPSDAPQSSGVQKKSKMNLIPKPSAFSDIIPPGSPTFLFEYLSFRSEVPVKALFHL